MKNLQIWSELSVTDDKAKHSKILDARSQPLMPLGRFGK